MSSRTRKWNRKPGDKLFQFGYNKSEREQLKARHQWIKQHQKDALKSLGLEK